VVTGFREAARCIEGAGVVQAYEEPELALMMHHRGIERRAIEQNAD